MDNTNTETTNVPLQRIKRTSFNVPADLWHKFRLAALERQKTAGEALEDAIRAWIAGPDGKAA